MLEFRVDVDDARLTHLADLARLALHDDDRASLREDLRRLIDYLAHLQDVDVDGVEPLHRPLAQDVTRGAPAGTRADAIDARRALSAQALVELAPAVVEGRVRVARTVDEAG